MERIQESVMLKFERSELDDLLDDLQNAIQYLDGEEGSEAGELADALSHWRANLKLSVLS